MQIMVATEHKRAFSLTPAEERILKVLRKQPLSLLQLADAAGVPHWGLLELERIEAHHLVQRCGLTPTDILHTNGTLNLWDSEASDRLTAMMAMLCKLDPGAFCELVLDRIADSLVAQLLKRQLPGSVDPDELDQSAVCQAWLDNLRTGGDEGYRVAIRLKQPVVGLGAPVGFFLPAATNRLQAELVIPPNADVANAIGAITSSVTVAKQVRILPGDDGGFVIHGLPESAVFEDFEDAHEMAVTGLKREVRAMARQAGTLREEVALAVNDRIVTAADGVEVFLERIIDAEISGPPDGVR